MERIFTELSRRRDEIAQLFAHGKEKKEISELLGISVFTVDNTLKIVYTQLNVRNGRELAIMMARRITGQDISLDI